MRSSGPINGEWMYPRLLVVEDNPLNQRLAERVLVKMNFCVDVVGNGQEAVAAAAERDYLAILMDCQMPVLDGFEATRAIRASGGLRSRTPIIAMTAFDTTETRERCRDAGMDAFAAKPVDWSKVETLLHGTVAGSPASVRPDVDLAVDPADRADAVLDPVVLDRFVDDGGGIETVAEVARLLRGQCETLFDRLGVALAAGDVDESRTVCTDLRGMVSSIGAERLATLMTDVGAMIDRGDTGAAVGSADRIWDELALVLDELDAWVATRRAPITADGVATAPSPWPAPSVADLVHAG